MFKTETVLGINDNGLYFRFWSGNKSGNNFLNFIDKKTSYKFMGEIEPTPEQWQKVIDEHLKNKATFIPEIMLKKLNFNKDLFQLCNYKLTEKMGERIYNKIVGTKRK